MSKDNTIRDAIKLLNRVKYHFENEATDPVLLEEIYVTIYRLKEAENDDVHLKKRNSLLLKAAEIVGLLRRMLY